MVFQLGDVVDARDVRDVDWCAVRDLYRHEPFGGFHLQGVFRAAHQFTHNQTCAVFRLRIDHNRRSNYQFVLARTIDHQTITGPLFTRDLPLIAQR